MALKKFNTLKVFMLKILTLILGCMPTFLWAKEPIVLQLKWLHQFQFAGYYAAKEKGYYAEAGFDVTILERDPKISPVQAVMENQADFGIVGSSIILDRMKGLPVVALGAVFQHSPLVLITRKEDHILSPYELKGKRVMYNKGNDDATFIAMFNHLGLGRSDFIHIPHSFDSSSLIRGETDAISAYLTNQPYYYKEKGLDIHIISPINYGIDLYDDILFTSEDAVRTNPERVRKFLDASMKGWRYALENKPEVIGWFKNKYPSKKSLSQLRFEADATEKMIIPQLIDIGHMNTSRFQRIAEIYKTQGLVAIDASYQGVDFKDYENSQNDLPFWVKILFVITVSSFVLVLGLLALTRRLKTMVKIRTSELSKSQTILSRYVDTVDLYVISSQTDIQGIITDASTAFCNISGYTKDELIGQSQNIVKHPDTSSELYKGLLEVITKGNVWTGEIKNKSKDGTDYWVSASINPIINEADEITGYIYIQQDITDKKQVEKLSITDSLTGLNNRLRLDEILIDEYKRGQRYNNHLSLIICDIDYFKIVNDTHGHLVGDQVLIAIANILLINCREVDVVGRWGGEEFLIICRETNADGAMILAEKLRSSIEAYDFPMVGKKTGSFGVTLVSFSESVENALQRADNALYEAKESGRNRAVLKLKTDQKP